MGIFLFGSLSLLLLMSGLNSDAKWEKKVSDVTLKSFWFWWSEATSWWSFPSLVVISTYKSSENVSLRNTIFRCRKCCVEWILEYFSFLKSRRSILFIVLWFMEILVKNYLVCQFLLPSSYGIHYVIIILFHLIKGSRRKRKKKIPAGVDSSL